MPPTDPDKLAAYLGKPAPPVPTVDPLDHLRLIHARLVDLAAELDAIEFPPITEPGALTMARRGKISDSRQWLGFAVADLGYVLGDRT